MNNAKGYFPSSHVEAMYLAITQGKEGEVAKAKRNAEQVWHNNLYALLASINLRGNIRREAHPAAYKILRKYGKECRTRFRPYKHCYDGRVNGLGQCTQNSILEALDTGMELWSGYASFVGSTSWHAWNVDAQGFVHDSSYGVESVFCRYWGVRLDPYIAYEIAVEKSRTGLEGIFLSWNHFAASYGLCRKFLGPEATDEFFRIAVELAFKQIAILP